jgi:3-oxoacyl-[acyl-carrier protein] reductase
MNKKKNILILGGSSDIGVEVAKLFLSYNWSVDLHFNNNYKIVKNLELYSNKIKFIKMNFYNINSSTIDIDIKKKFNKKYNSVINLVGYTDNIGFENTTIKSIIKSLSINTIIPIIIEKFLIKNMLKQKWGRILNCSSIGVKFGGGINTYNYSFSKHALEFIPSKYKHWARKNVLINNLRIGVTDTKIHKRIHNKNLKDRVKLIPAGRMATKQEIAKFIFQLSSEKNTFITGETLSIAGGE